MYFAESTKETEYLPAFYSFLELKTRHKANKSDLLT